MTKYEIQNLCTTLGKRAQELDEAFEAGSIGEERYITERTALDTIVSFVSTEIGYEPNKYLRYSDIIAAKEMAKARDRVVKRLETEYKNKAEAEAKARNLVAAFMASMQTAQSNIA